MSALIRILLVLVMGAVAGCSPRFVHFNMDNFADPCFYQTLPYILNCDLRIDGVTIYQTTFAEKPYEGYYVIDYSEVNERNDKNILHYKPFKGYYQKLFLLNLATYPRDSLTIYFSLKYNCFDQCVGFGPAYLGRMDESRKLIYFSSELYTRSKKDFFYLRKGRLPLKLYMVATEIQPGVYINIDKLIVEKSFEIGNNVVIDIPRIFHDPCALKFEYLDTRMMR